MEPRAATRSGGSPLDRLLRDAITLTQHVVAQGRMLEMIGGVVVGEEAPIPFL